MAGTASGATSALDQEYAWELDVGNLDDREDEHDGREPSEDELHFYDKDNKASIHAANVQAKKALQALLKRLRRKASRRFTSGFSALAANRDSN